MYFLSRLRSQFDAAQVIGVRYRAQQDKSDASAISPEIGSIPALYKTSIGLTNDGASSSNSAETNEQWLTLGYEALQNLHILVQTIVSSTNVLAEDIDYWQSLLLTKRWRYVLLLQRMTSMSICLSADFPMALWASITGAPETSSIQRLVSTTTAVNVLQKQSSIDLLLKQEIRDNIDKLSDKREELASIIGYFASEFSLNVHDRPQDIVSKLIFVTQCASQGRNLEYSRSVPDFLLSTKEMNTSRNNLRKGFYLAADMPCKPSSFVRYWPILAASVISIPSLANWLLWTQKSYIDWALEGRRTLTDFWHNWVIDPVVQIFGTIRHDTNSELNLIGTKSLTADMDSLVRMVIDFTKEHPEFANAASDDLRKAALQGDLTPILVSYEHDLRNPLYSALFGSLIQVLLIQVQKAKVDIALAISGIDKLLKSQQLVFGVLGASPVMLFGWLIFRAFKTNPRTKKIRQENHAKIYVSLCKIQRIMEQASAPDLSYKCRGTILCELRLLDQWIPCLNENLRDTFRSDLVQLEIQIVGPIQKLRHTILRMLRSVTYSAGK